MLKKKAPPSGAPEWVLTYGDMMSLLLCFFILLAAFADFEQGGGRSENVQAAIASIQQALGMTSPKMAVSNAAIEFNALLDKLVATVKSYEERNRSNTREAGVSGKTFRLRRIRDGMEITIGGPILFEPFSAVPSPEGREALTQIAVALKGHRNKLEIRGHAADEPAPTDWTFDDAMRLSYERAHKVADELIARGVDPRAIRVVAAGASEPLPDRYDTTSRGENRRAEILVRESLVDDYLQQLPPPATRPSATQPPSR